MILFLWGSWQLPLLGPDEPRYSQVAREMYETGDYITPKLGGYIWFEKPILLYWLIAGSYAIFGVNEFAARLPSALVAAASIWFLYITLRRIAGETSALLASAILASTAFFVGFSHAATFDMLLTFCVTVSLCSYLLHEREPERKRWWILMYAFAGLGVLAKGFVALIIIGLTVFIYLLISKRWKNVFAMKPVWGILITAAVIAIWFLPVSMIFGLRFWDEFVYQHHFVRYTSSYYHRSQSVWFYLPILLAGTYPWSFAPFASRSNGDRNLFRFALCWLICPFLFFSLSQTKLPGYILPVVPAFAILAGIALAHLQKPSRLILLSSALQAILIAAFFWGASKYSVSIKPLFWMMVFIVFLTAISIVLLLYKKRTAAFVSYSLILFAGMVLFVHFIFPALPWSDSKSLSLQWTQQVSGNQKLVPYNVYDFGPLYYTNGRLELNPQGYPKILTDASQLHRYLIQQGEAYVYTGNDDLEWMQRADFWKVNRVLKGRERSIVHLMAKKIHR